MNFRQQILIAIVIILVVGAVITFSMKKSPKPPATVPTQPTALSWDECIKLPGSITQQSHPSICVAKDGRRVSAPERGELETDDNLEAATAAVKLLEELGER